MKRLMRTAWAGAAVACGMVLALLVGVVPAQAQSAVASSADGASSDVASADHPRGRAKEAVEAMMEFYDAETGRWDPESPWWQSGDSLQALLDYTAKTGSRKYLRHINNTIEQQRQPLPWWPEGGGEFRADSTDDTGWWALAMVRMYDITGDAEYLDIAELDAEYMGDYWDDTCGGGIWWDIPDQSYKNAISIELYIKLLASLHNRIPGDTDYLDQALEAWEWFDDSGMINDANLVNDGLNTQDGGCANNGGTTWTYNQGVILGAAAELYRATGDSEFLDDAREIADAVIASSELSPDGILTEPCEHVGSCNTDQEAFKGIFARNLAELNDVLPDRPYRDYLVAQAESAHALARNSSGQYGLSWSGPFDTATIGRQASAVSLLTAVL